MSELLKNQLVDRKSRNLAWESCLHAKSITVLILFLPLFFFGSFAATPAQQEEEFHLPPSRTVMLPPESYSFAMNLPPGTDCSVRMKLKGSKEENKGSGTVGGKNTKEESMYALHIERMFRDGICLSKQLKSDKSDVSYYFLKGWCAYDTPSLGLNVRRHLEESQLCDLSIYHFPELVWAVPETRQPDPEVPEGQPAVHEYKDGDAVLVTDAVSGYPVRYSDGNSQWTYSYKSSNSPIVLPEKLQQALDRIIKRSRDQ